MAINLMHTSSTNINHAVTFCRDSIAFQSFHFT